MIKIPLLPQTQVKARPPFLVYTFNIFNGRPTLKLLDDFKQRNMTRKKTNDEMNMIWHNDII